MNTKIKDFSEYIKGKTVALVGAGVSNMAAVDFLLSLGAVLTVRDKNAMFDAEEAKKLESKGISTFFGDGYLENLYEDVIFKSPGIRPDVSELLAAKARGAVVTSEMEVFLSLCPAKKYAVTGSDGKTTTTTLISELLRIEYERKKNGGRVYLGGNIGTPLLPIVGKMTERDAAVVELSSFQLFSMSAHIDVAVITNITPNHLNWHISMEEYVGAKAKIFENQTENDRLVLNFENEITRSFAEKANSDITFFSSKREVPGVRAVFLRGDDIIYTDGKTEKLIMNRKIIRIPGMHNVENYMAACAAVRSEVSDEIIREVAMNFPGVEHRIELVAEKNGIKYYNSSIDTSPTRTAAALSSFEKKLVVIVGGYDKNIPLEPLAPILYDKAKFISATGNTGEKIMRMMLDFGYPCDKIVYTKDFDGAFKVACDNAVKGDSVILSPACASFDAFKNFAERGEYFKNLVYGITE